MTLTNQSPSLTILPVNNPADTEVAYTAYVSQGQAWDIATSLIQQLRNAAFAPPRSAGYMVMFSGDSPRHGDSEICMSLNKVVDQHVQPASKPEAASPITKIGPHVITIKHGAREISGYVDGVEVYSVYLQHTDVGTRVGSATAPSGDIMKSKATVTCMSMVIAAVEAWQAKYDT